MFPIEFRRDWHFITTIPFEHKAKDILGRWYDVFTYKHKLTGNWMVAHWVEKSKGRMQELVCLGKAPVGSREAVKKLELFRPDNAEAERNRKLNRQDLGQYERRMAIQDQEFWDDQADNWEGIRKGCSPHVQDHPMWRGKTKTRKPCRIQVAAS